MAWIKRNLALVISGVVALGLLGWGGWYFWSALKTNAEVDNDIEQTKRDIERFLTMPVSPNASNLNAAKRELERLNQFIAESRKLFPPSPAPTEPLNALSFKSMLETTINDLYQQAKTVGIQLPTNYYFSFEAQRLPVTFPPESLLPLKDRLHEVQMLTSILINARVNRLDSVRRAMVPGERPGNVPGGGAGATDDYVKAAPRINQETGMALWPYELNFQCFSAELATVLEALQKAKYGFVVKAVSSEPVPEAAPARPVAQPGGRTNAPVARAGTLETVINERLLRISLQVEVIKPQAR